jgi:hypothetical protein
MTIPPRGGKRFDMRTHNAARAAPAGGDERAKAAPHRLQIAQHAVEHRDLFPSEPLNVDARCLSGLAQADDLTDLGHAEPEATGLCDEYDELHGLAAIHSIPGRRASHRSENSSGFIHTKRLAAYACPCAECADRQFRHALTVDPALGAGSSMFVVVQRAIRRSRSSFTVTSCTACST